MNYKISNTFILTLALSTVSCYGDFGLNSITNHMIGELKSTIKGKVNHFARDYARDRDLNHPKLNMETKRKKIGKRLKFPINYTTLFSSQNCNQVIQRSAYISCYDYNTKGSHILAYRLSKNDLTRGYIQRPDGDPFYDDKAIPRTKRVNAYSYRGSHYDRGHLRPYASSAYSQEMVNQTYSLVNVLPQTPELNRKRWVKAEKYERLIAKKIGQVDVVNIADYSQSSKRIGRDGILVPTGFYKIIIGNDFKRCFYYKNSRKHIPNDKLKDHVIDCNSVYY